MNLADLTGPFTPDVSFPANDGNSHPVSPATVGPRAVYQVPVAAVQSQLREQNHIRDTVPTTSTLWPREASLPAHIKLSDDISQQVKRQLSDDAKCIVYHASRSAADGVKSVQFTEYAQNLMRQDGFSEEELSSAVKMCSMVDSSDTCHKRDDDCELQRQIYFVANPKVNEWILNHLMSSSDLDRDVDDMIFEYSDGNRWHPSGFFGATVPQTLVDDRYVLISKQHGSPFEPADLSVNVQKYISDRIARHHCDTLSRLSEIVECSSSDNDEKLSILSDFLKPYRSNPGDSETR